MAITRLSGLASGMDYESIIKKLMTAESSKLNKLKQRKQIIQWQEEAYRELNSSMLTLRTEAMTMKLSSTYKTYNVSSSDETTVTATGTSAAVEGTYKLTVTQLATTAEKTSASTVSPPLQSSAAVDFSSPLDLSGKDFYVTFEGVQKHISWDAAEAPFANIDDLVTSLQDKIDESFGSNQVTVSKDVATGTKLVFSATDPVYKSKITLSAGTTSNALTNFNFDDGDSSQISTATQLKDLVFASGTSLVFDPVDNKLNFSINGKSFEFNNTDSLSDVFTAVNSDTDADVNMGYDAAKDIIYIRRKGSGAGKTIEITEDGVTGNFAAAVGFGATVPGQNALMSFTDNNGITTSIEKASNKFTLAGISFSLLKEDAATEKTITVSKDVDGVYDKIKNFIDKYNDTIDKLNSKLSEKRELEYQPLTDEQKESMSEEQITLWETKAKTGIIRGDATLQGFVRELRTIMSNSVAGLSSSMNQLKSVGISSISYYDEGKLYIDETKLKQAISEHPDEVAALFSTSPSNLSGTELSGIINVDTKDIKVSLNGVAQNITLSGSYDMSTSDGKTGLITEINDKLADAFGSSQVIASLSTGNEIIISSPKGYSVTLNSGTVNDGLATLGFTDGDTYDSSNKGVMVKIYDKLSIAIKSLSDKAGSSSGSVAFDNSILGKQISDINTRINRENDRLADVEERYYKQFYAMESYLSQMNMQSSWLSQQTAK